MNTTQSDAVLLISPEPWRGNFVSKHHYAIALSRIGHTVFFLNPPKQARKDIEVCEVTRYPGLFEVDMRSVGRGMRFYPRALRRATERRWLEKLETLTGKRVSTVWLFENSRFFDMNFAGDRLKIYHQVDMNQAAQVRWAASTADICFAVSDQIANKLRKYHRDVYKIQHGVQWMDSPPTMPTEFSERLDANRINAVYVGNLDIPYIDVDLLSSLVERFPQVLFHFIGTAKEDGRLRQVVGRAANVKWWGRVDSEWIPSILHRCDVLLVVYLAALYREQLANPHKIMEYLASGKTVVATYTDEYKSTKDLVEMVNDERNFVDAFSNVIRHIDHFNSEEKQDARRRYAKDNTYEKQLERINHLLLDNGLPSIPGVECSAPE